MSEETGANGHVLEDMSERADGSRAAAAAGQGGASADGHGTSGEDVQHAPGTDRHGTTGAAGQGTPGAEGQHAPGAAGQGTPGAEGQHAPGTAGQGTPDAAGRVLGTDGHGTPGAAGQATPGAEGQHAPGAAGQAATPEHPRESQGARGAEDPPGWPDPRLLQPGDRLVVQVDRGRLGAYFDYLVRLAAEAPSELSIAPVCARPGGLMRLHLIAAARIALPARVRVEARHDLLGIRLAQVALGFGADTLAGPMTAARRLPLAGVPRPDEATPAGLAALVERAGLEAVLHDMTQETSS